MSTRAARERIAAIRSQSEFGDGRSDGHISYNSFLMNFIGDLNDREERAIVGGFQRTRKAASHGVPVRSRNVLMAEGEPTPRAQRILREKSRTAIRDRNPIGYGNLQIGPTPRYHSGKGSVAPSPMPADSLHRLEQQFSQRSGGSQRHTARSGGNTARSQQSPLSHRSQHNQRSQRSHRSPTVGALTARSTASKGTAYSSPRWSDMSSLSSGFNSYRSMDSNMTDISMGDIDALAAQKIRLEQRINTINKKMTMRATMSPKMKYFSKAKQQRKEEEKNDDDDERLESLSMQSNGSNTNRRQHNIVHLGETGNPAIVHTSRSETTKLMNTLANHLGNL
jgi:hypothetical protein